MATGIRGSAEILVKREPSGRASGAARHASEQHAIGRLSNGWQGGDNASAVSATPANYVPYGPRARRGTALDYSRGDISDARTGKLSTKLSGQVLPILPFPAEARRARLSAVRYAERFTTKTAAERWTRDVRYLGAKVRVPARGPRSGRCVWRPRGPSVRIARPRRQAPGRRTRHAASLHRPLRCWQPPVFSAETSSKPTLPASAAFRVSDTTTARATYRRWYAIAVNGSAEADQREPAKAQATDHGVPDPGRVAGGGGASSGHKDPRRTGPRIVRQGASRGVSGQTTSQTS